MLKPPILPLLAGASWPWIDPQMLPWWGGMGQGRRGARGPAESLYPKMPIGRAGGRRHSDPFVTMQWIN